MHIGCVSFLYSHVSGLGEPYDFDQALEAHSIYHINSAVSQVKGGKRQRRDFCVLFLWLVADLPLYARHWSWSDICRKKLKRLVF